MPRVPNSVAWAACVGVLAVPALLPAGIAVPGAPPAAHAGERKAGPVDRALTAVQSAQRADGGFATSPADASSDPATSVWAALSLAAIGINPADQPRRGTTVLEYLTAHATALQGTGDLARLAIVLRAAGPAGDEARRTVVAALTGRQAADGGFPERSGGPADVAATAFAALALAGDPTAATAAPRASAWLRSANRGGGWGASPGAPTDAGITGLALQALRAVEPNEFAVTTRAQTFLRRRGNPDGGLGAASPKASDPVATAWAMQGLRASEVDPRTYESLGGGTPSSFLAGRQRSDGGFGSTLRTAQVLAGLNGSAFPLQAVAAGSARANARAAKPTAARSRRTDRAGGTDEPTETLGGGQADRPGSGGDPSPSGDAPSGSPDPGASLPSSPSPTPSPASPTAPMPTPTPAAPAPEPTPSTGGAAPAPVPTAPKDDAPKAKAPKDEPTATGDQVDGVVVGAQQVAATTGPGVAGAAAASSDGDDRTTAALGGAVLLVALAGTQLERRRPRRVLS